MQEMSVSGSTSVEKLMTFNVYEGLINCMGILIDLFEVDMSTGAHVTREGELCIEASLHLKNLVQTKRNPCYPVIFDLFKFGEFLFLMGMLDMGFFRWFCEDGVGGYHMITFSASEA